MSLVVEGVLVCFLIKRAGRSERHPFFRGVGAASESGFGVAGAIGSGSCVFVCFTGNNRGKIDRIQAILSLNMRR